MDFVEGLSESEKKEVIPAFVDSPISSFHGSATHKVNFASGSTLQVARDAPRPARIVSDQYRVFTGQFWQ